ncbi:hypothetical protein LXL04_004152 [Taraxacum kok-saghyz]
MEKRFWILEAMEENVSFLLLVAGGTPETSLECSSQRRSPARLLSPSSVTPTATRKANCNRRSSYRPLICFLSTFPVDFRSVQANSFVFSIVGVALCVETTHYGDEVFTTRENLKEWVDNVARNLGYVVITKRSKTKISGYFVIVVVSIEVQIHLAEIRRKKINCPFELVGNYYKTYDFWTLTVKNGEHNHDPAIYMEGHAFAKRLTKDERRMVEDMTDNNVPPRDILSTLIM